MNSSIIELFKSKKIKVISSYAKILEELITLEDNTLWKKSKEFWPICEGVVSYFVDRYYFDNNINRNNPVEYLNDNINAVLISIMDYYKKQNTSDVIKNKKNETFLISVIICVASYIDIASNVIDGDYNLMKKNLAKLLKYLNKTETLKIYINNKIIINKLLKVVKQNVNNEKKFFAYFKNSNWHNEYQIVSRNPIYYKVRFIYKVENIESKNYQLIKRIQKKYLKKYLDICYELLVILLMKEYIMNKKVNTYLVPVIDDNLDLLRILDCDMIKENIKLLIPIENKNKYKISNFNLIYTYNGLDKDVLLPYKNIEVMVKKKFMEKNKKELENFNKQNIKLIVEDIGKCVTENMICGIKEEIL